MGWTRLRCPAGALKPSESAVNDVSTPERDSANFFEPRNPLLSFLDDAASQQPDDSSQRQAGAAAASAALAAVYGLNAQEFNSGASSVRGAFSAAGSQRLTTPDPDIPADVGAAAFFDVDNTLIHGSSLIQLALGMARQRFFSPRELASMMWTQAKFWLTGAESPEDIEAGRRQALNFIKGRRVDELQELGDVIVDTKVLSRVYESTRELAQMHLDAGQQVWLVTATPVQLAQALAIRLGFTGALGTVPEQVDGVFTGRLVGDVLHGAGKRHAVAALAALENLDLDRCTAYSDSSNDIPMLSMVGTAVAINPDRTLKAEAKRRGWLIRDFRTVRRGLRIGALSALAVAAAAEIARFGRHWRGN